MQAITRIYRFGQARPAYVYRLVYAGTLEQEVYHLNIQKEELFSKVGALVYNCSPRGLCHYMPCTRQGLPLLLLSVLVPSLVENPTLCITHHLALTLPCVYLPYALLAFAGGGQEGCQKGVHRTRSNWTVASMVLA